MKYRKADIPLRHFIVSSTNLGVLIDAPNFMQAIRLFKKRYPGEKVIEFIENSRCKFYLL
jgi:hypothetical protein